jgi:UDP-N-acetylmuramate dehydrogenase
VLPARGVVIRARLRAAPGEPAAIAARMRGIRRRARQRSRAGAPGGSTFRNPKDSGPGRDRTPPAAGLRWRALVSEKHANFLVNTAAPARRRSRRWASGTGR